VRPGDLLGERFEIGELAGRGGMGDVFRAWDRRDRRLVAVKCARVRASREDLKRFEQEVRVLRDLRHDAIVAYVDDGVLDGGRPWLAMEWVEGEDLRTTLSRGPLAIPEALSLAIRVADALGAAHAAGIVHRDVKPANLLLVGGDPTAVKVVDFGVARLVDSLGESSFSVTGDVVGTPAYMAPEQARGERDVDARADVFALGCVLYACLVGQPPFAGAHPIAILAKVLLAEAPRLRTSLPGIAPELDALVARALAKERDERPHDGAAMARALPKLARVLPKLAHRQQR
jgi:serine/threonine protein kinase